MWTRRPEVFRRGAIWASLLCAHLVHAISLHDIGDGLRLNRGLLVTLRGTTPPSRNNLSHPNKGREIDCLPPEEWAEVVRHAKKLEEIPQLSPEEIGVLVDQFVEATDPAKVEQLRETIAQGFYGCR